MPDADCTSPQVCVLSRVAPMLSKFSLLARAGDGSNPAVI